MNIYNLKQDLIEIFEELEENGGELTPEIEERLQFTQDEAKTKVQEYTDVIKLLKGDIADIDMETKRLKELKARKKKVIESISNLIIIAIQYFGDTSKSGAKYIDYGTGKVSIRHSKSYVQNENNTKGIVDTFFQYFEWLRNNNQLELADSVDVDSLKQMLENYKRYVGDELVPTPIELDDNDLENLNADIKFSIPLSSICKGKGFDLIKELVEYTSAYNAEPSINKIALKNREDELPNLGCVEEKDNLVIK